MEAEAGERMIAAIERVAVANEQLIVLATEERSVNDNLLGPPVCPFCGTFSPEIRSEGGTGPMQEYVLIAHCSCGRQFFAIPQGWLVVGTANDAKALIEGRTTNER